ncbi:hypothetical protein B0H16DRAFT_1879550 [Mycena metata]|uniref:F-box domain-containing protein n=1 Tax=Mycena metata TaxID=1033252 RepID=A0AAD7K157_9AGAR|nr:hypothetical protein B0H16DRAFT_1879550 [Mycena metata]
MRPPAVHSLPTETLTDIFRFTSTLPSFWQAAQAPVVQTELERIANAPLLVLSRVCSRWHHIAINNPTFWSNVEINGVLWRTPRTLEKTQNLLCARLQRSGDVPLSIALVCEDKPLPPRFFSLLAQHSHRWETVAVICSLEGTDTLVLEGKLPLLKKLLLNVVVPMTVDFVGTAPRLEGLSVTASLLKSESFSAIIRRKQLRSFGCVVGPFPCDFQKVVSLLPDLPVAIPVYLTISLPSRIYQPHWIIPLDLLQPTTAPISALSCTAVGEFYSHHVSSVLGQLITSLTLPELHRVMLGAVRYPRRMLEWPHTQFLGLCERSDLGRTLKTLCIAEVQITENDLLETLSVLNALEFLEVGDAPANVTERTDSESDLITDSFLCAMIRGPAQCLSPRRFGRIQIGTAI